MVMYNYDVYYVSTEYVKRTPYTSTTSVHSAAATGLYSDYTFSSSSGFSGVGLSSVPYDSRTGYYTVSRTSVSYYQRILPEESTDDRVAYIVQITSASTREQRAGFKETIQAEDGDYPDNGVSGSFWYVKKEKSNKSPTVLDNTTQYKTLYEGDIITLNGNVKDEDNGDVVTLRYNINNGTTRALSSNISQGRDIPYNKTLTFKEGFLYDGISKVSNNLSDGTKHLIKLWAEDDKGGKSNEVLINFYVVNNRPASLTINSMIEQNDLIDTDTYLITGSVKDPDGNETTLSYKVNSSSYSTINSGKDRDFEVRIPVSRFNEGSNTVTFRAKDTYGAITEKVARITKDKNITPLKTAIREYKMLPPEGKAKGILLWIQRETGDLTTKVEIKFGSSPYKTLESDNTAPVGVGIEEDEYYYENDKEESDIRLRITMERSSLSSTKGIKLISGVFN